MTQSDGERFNAALYDIVERNFRGTACRRTGRCDRVRRARASSVGRTSPAEPTVILIGDLYKECK